MEGPTSKKTKEPPKKVNHKGNIKFLDPLVSWEALLKGFAKQPPWKDETTFVIY
jgi:hypothetical protein